MAEREETAFLSDRGLSFLPRGHILPTPLFHHEYSMVIFPYIPILSLLGRIPHGQDVASFHIFTRAWHIVVVQECFHNEDV